MSLAGIEQLRRKSDMGLSICDTSWLEPKHVPPCRPAPPMPVLCQGCGGKGVSCARCKGTGLVFPPNRPRVEYRNPTTPFGDLGQGIACIMEGELSLFPPIVYAAALGILVAPGIAVSMLGSAVATGIFCVLASAFVYLENQGPRPSITNNPGTQ